MLSTFGFPVSNCGIIANVRTTVSPGFQARVIIAYPDRMLSPTACPLITKVARLHQAGIRKDNSQGLLWVCSMVIAMSPRYGNVVSIRNVANGVCALAAA